MQYVARPGLNRARKLLICLCLSLWWAIPVGRVGAQAPAAVGLTSFTATPLDNAVRLEWRTETEVGTVAYTIKRAVAGGPLFWLQNVGEQGYIVAEGGPAMGGNYLVVDNTAVNGQTYNYRLFEIEADATEVELASLFVTAGIPTPTSTPTPTVTPTPVAISGGHNPSPPSPRPPGPFATATPDATSIPTATPTSTTAAATAPGPLPSATRSPGSQPLATQAPPALIPTSTPAVAPILPESGGQPIATASDQSAAGFAPPVALAQGEVEPTATGSYPGPALIAATSSPEDDAYPPPPPESETETLQEATPYPPRPETFGGPNVAVIGAQDDGDQTESQVDASGGSAIGRVYLWATFILALLIFAASVVGSILLFRRKSN